MEGIPLYTRLLYGLVWLAMGLYTRALYKGLYYILSLFVMFLYYGLVSLRFVVMIGFIVWHCIRLAPFSITCGLPCVAIVWVYFIDSGGGLCQ